MNTETAAALSRMSGIHYADFQAEQIRSLTVLLSNAGKYQVFAHRENDGAIHFPGDFDSFDEARKVADALNRVVKTLPGAPLSEVLRLFIGPDLSAPFGW